MSNNFAIIPARSGSKGVKNKNIKDFGGYPLLAWTINICKKCKSIDRIFLSTDSEEYADIGKFYGAEVPFIRPNNIAGDKSTDLEFINHFIDWLDSNRLKCRNILHMRPTTPLRDPKIIEDALISFEKSDSTSALRSVHKMSESAYKTFEISGNGFLQCVGSKSALLDESNKARQQFPETYFANGYVDVLSYDFIKNNQLLHGRKVMPFFTECAYEVDTPDDFEFLEFILSKNPSLIKFVFS
tara:strand:+ start:307 stop:1032 length:726 start_codon:yes stop_codon:yes gene_type:complete